MVIEKQLNCTNEENVHVVAGHLLFSESEQEIRFSGIIYRLEEGQVNSFTGQALTSLGEAKLTAQIQEGGLSLTITWDSGKNCCLVLKLDSQQIYWGGLDGLISSTDERVNFALCMFLSAGSEDTTLASRPVDLRRGGDWFG